MASYAAGDLTRDGDTVVEVVTASDAVQPGYTQVSTNGPADAYLAPTDSLGDPEGQVCAHCGQPITGGPVTDCNQTFWLDPADRDVWCTQQCHDDHAEQLSAS